MARLVKRGVVWMVPAQSGGSPYEVDPTTPHCTCPDHETSGVKCKHIYAVEYAMRRESNDDGAIGESMATERLPRKTYPQNWRAYNAAQTHEKARFQELLSELCTDIKEPARSRNGRPRIPITTRSSVCASRCTRRCRGGGS